MLSACEAKQEREHYQFSGGTMGTTYHITLVAEHGRALSVSTDDIEAGVDEALVLINQQMSTYINDSDLMRFNRSALHQWHALPEPLAEVLRVSQSISERSNGAFDITVGPLVNLWGFGPGGKPTQAPSDSYIAALRSQVGYHYLQLDGNNARRLADIQLDLSAVAKGYGVDYVARWLEAQGINHYLVEIGGEMRLAGQSPRGDAWRIGVEQPEQLQRAGRLALALSDIAMATSGEYRNYYERDGQRYSHTIDPRTGKPIQHNLASVTVLAETSAEADAWATTLNVLGPDAGMALAEQEKLAVYMIVKTDEGFRDRYSKAFEPWLTAGE